MRGPIALVFLLGGIASLVWGVGQLVGAIDGSPVGPLAVGVPMLLIGVLVIRRMSGESSEMPRTAPELLADHSLTEPTSTFEPEVPTYDPSTTRSRAGVAVLVAAAVIVAGVGAAVFTVVAEEAGPNVAQHVIDACHDALRAEEGPSASYGVVTSYESAGLGIEEVRFETSQGGSWLCTYDTEDRTAFVSDLVKP